METKQKPPGQNVDQELALGLLARRSSASQDVGGEVMKRTRELDQGADIDQTKLLAVVETTGARPVGRFGQPWNSACDSLSSR